MTAVFHAMSNNGFIETKHIFQREKFYRMNPDTDFPKRQDKNPNLASQGRTNPTS